MKFWLLDLPEELKAPLEEIKSQLSFSIEDGGRAVKVQKGEKPCIDATHEEILLTYHKKVEFFRLLTLLPSHTEGIYEETPAHEDLCLMSDCSRNAVFNIKGAKKMIRALALMGFTSFMLYIEDTYEVPGYPFFGYQRGRFSQEEMKEIDDYAYSFGIEVIPCMQTLAHLNATLRWPGFSEINDVSDILLVGEEKTYQLIDAMFRSLRKVFRTKKIHIGMDEAHLLGAGKYLDRNGYRPRAEILLEHLQKVCKMCEEYDFYPMMWSDMFFRIQFGTYYVEEGELEQKVLDLVPENLGMVYWDYYSEKEDLFRHMVKCHKQFKNPMIFAGGAWKWYGMTPYNFFSLKVNEIHLRVAREERVPMVIATAWGDNGAEASQFSILPTLQQYAEYCYAKGEDRAWVAKRFEETFKIPFDTFLLIDAPALLSDNKEKLSRKEVNPKHLLYNDPLAGWVDWCIKPEYATEYAEIARSLHEIPENQFGYLFESAARLSDVLTLKATLSLEIRAAYHADDRGTLEEIIANRIPAAIKALENYLPAARAEWYEDNKIYGFDVVEMRIGALKERLASTALILKDYLAGKIHEIPQLEEPLLEGPAPINNWAKLVTCVVN